VVDIKCRLWDYIERLWIFVNLFFFFLRREEREVGIWEENKDMLVIKKTLIYKLRLDTQKGKLHWEETYKVFGLGNKR
jgi:hypothetical protein